MKTFLLCPCLVWSCCRHCYSLILCPGIHQTSWSTYQAEEKQWEKCYRCLQVEKHASVAHDAPWYLGLHVEFLLLHDLHLQFILWRFFKQLWKWALGNIMVNILLKFFFYITWKIWYKTRTSSFSSLCFSSASFSSMFACVSLVSSSFSFRSLCLKTFSRFWKTVRGTDESFLHRQLFHFFGYKKVKFSVLINVKL